VSPASRDIDTIADDIDRSIVGLDGVQDEIARVFLRLGRGDPALVPARRRLTRSLRRIAKIQAQVLRLSTEISRVARFDKAGAP
jgi:hypothetical protein